MIRNPVCAHEGSFSTGQRIDKLKKQTVVRSTPRRGRKRAVFLIAIDIHVQMCLLFDSPEFNPGLDFSRTLTNHQVLCLLATLLSPKWKNRDLSPFCGNVDLNLC